MDVYVHIARYSVPLLHLLSWSGECLHICQWTTPQLVSCCGDFDLCIPRLLCKLEGLVASVECGR